MAIVTKYTRTNRVTTGVHICTNIKFERNQGVPKWRLERRPISFGASKLKICAEGKDGLKWIWHLMWKPGVGFDLMLIEAVIANFEFPTWRRHIFSTESQIPGKQIGHLFWIHLGNPFVLILNILEHNGARSLILRRSGFGWKWQKMPSCGKREPPIWRAKFNNILLHFYGIWRKSTQQHRPYVT